MVQFILSIHQHSYTDKTIIGSKILNIAENGVVATEWA